MEPITKFFSVLAICIILVPNQAAAEPRGKEVINTVCQQTATKDLCEQVLTSDPSSADATLKDLALISLRVASANASDILTEVKKLIDDTNLDPEIQQGLADCKATILDAEGQLEDTIAALLENDETDAQIWLQAALAAITTCDDSIPGNDDVLSVMSVNFRKLCNIAVTISKALPKN